MTALRTYTGIAVMCEGVSHSFAQRVVLDDVRLQLHQGETLAVVGASGSGKSTLLYALAGLRRPDDGRVDWGDQTDIWRLREPRLTLFRREFCGFVFQFPAFLDDFTILENVAVPLIVAKRRRSDARRTACDLLRRFGLDHLLDAYPSTLSSGELQRASIARALTMNPRVVFCDEPTGALDEDNSNLVISELSAAASTLGVGVLIVTHDPMVSGACDRVLRLSQGKLLNDTMG